MGIGDWLRRGNDPVLQHLVDAYGLTGGARDLFDGGFRAFELRTFGKQSFAKGINVELGDCAGEAKFGFYRPGDDDLRGAVAFGEDGMARWQHGEDVSLGGFFIDAESEDERWRTFLQRRAGDLADFLALYSPALDWVYLHFPGLVLRFAAPAGSDPAAPDLAAIDRDLAASARLLDYLRDAAGKDGLAP